jgi:hypothetical protein
MNAPGSRLPPEVVRAGDLALGAATLRLGPDGSPLNPLTVVDLDACAPADLRPAPAPFGLVVGVTERSVATDVAAHLTAVVRPDQLAAVEATVALAPVAALTLGALLRVTSAARVDDAMMAESAAYSMLLAGAEFARWRAATRRGPAAPVDQVRVERTRARLEVTLDRPDRHNAFGRAMRDGLLEALAIAELDPSITEVRLSGAGPSFCSGGDLDDFGTATDPALAHVVRLVASAGLAVHRLRDKVRPVLHGACIGAGIEIPAFASHVVAHDDAYFQLPELRMGLVPGAGGTVSVVRRIGRWRTAELALTGAPVDVATALAWGLVDECA